MGTLRVRITGAVVAMMVAVTVSAHARRTEVSGRNARFCSVWVDQKFNHRTEACLKRNELTSVYSASQRATVISGYEDNLDPTPVRNGVRRCLGAAVADALQEGSNRDAGGNLLFGKIDCSLKYINHMQHN
jgi:hypothetical protein